MPRQYVNPVPAIEAGKEFELRLRLKFDSLTELEEAKKNCAKYILGQSPETLASWLQCLSIKALYPSDLTSDELKSLTGGKESEAKHG